MSNKINRRNLVISTVSGLAGIVLGGCALGKRATPTPDLGESPVAGVDFLEILPDRYVLHEVRYQSDGVRRNISWSKELLDNGARHTPQDWTAFLRDQKSEWKLPDVYDFHNTLAALGWNMDQPEVSIVTEWFREHFYQKELKGNELLTCSKVNYRSKETDIVYHCIGNSSISIKQDIGGGWEYPKNSRERANMLDSLIGTHNDNEINKVTECLGVPYLISPTLIKKPTSGDLETPVYVGIITMFDNKCYCINMNPTIQTFLPQALGVSVTRS